MTVAGTTVEVEFTNVVVNVPLVVAIQSYDPAWFYVRWGLSRELAVPGVDYTVEYDNPSNPTYLLFNFTPLAPLLAKIGAGANVVYVGRQLALTTDFDLDDSFVREKIVTEFDKTIMRFQQLAFDMAFVLSTVDELDDAIAQAEAFALAASASATAAADSASAANASAVAAAASAGAAAASAAAAAASAASLTYATNTEMLTGTATNRMANPDNVATLWESSVAGVAGGATLAITDGGYAQVTGSGWTATAVTFNPDKAGRRIKVRFGAAGNTITPSGTLLLPGGQPIMTEAGDTAEFLSLGGGTILMTWYQRLSGLPVFTENAPTKSANYTAISSDNGKTFRCFGAAFTITLPPANVANNWSCTVVKIDNVAANVITIAGNGAELINGSATWTLTAREEFITVLSNGSNGWNIIRSNLKANTLDVVTGTDITKGVTPDSLAALWEHGGTVSAASGTITLGEGGTFTCNAGAGALVTSIVFSNPKAGRRALIWVSGVDFTLVHSANLLLPAGRNIDIKAGAWFEVWYRSGTEYHVTEITRSDGTPVWPDGATGHRNLLHNPYGQINQYPGIAIGDDNYGIDRWVLLTSGGTMIPVGQVDIDSTTPVCLRAENNTGSNQRWGFLQIMEGVEAKQLRGRPATLSGKMSAGAGVVQRYAILGWTGTIDAVPSDVVNDWTNGTFTAGQFFINTAGFTVIAVGSTTNVSGSMEELTPLTASIPTNINNLMLFYWRETGASPGTNLFLAPQFEAGSHATPREYRPIAQELAICQRFLERVPAPSAAYVFASGVMSTTTLAEGPFPYVKKHHVPTISYGGGAAADYEVRCTGTVAVSAVTAVNIGLQSACLQWTTAATTAAAGANLRAKTTNAVIVVEANL